MVELQKHIKDLLILHDCVIVPDIGGFVVDKVNADYNEVTGIFTPPRRKIIFNRSLSHNDGLLYNHIAHRYSLNYEDARKTVSLEIAKWVISLKNKEAINISDLGCLKADHDDHVIFTQSNECNITPDMYGLSTFHFKSLDQVNEIEKPTRHLVRRTIRSKSIRQIAAGIFILVGMLIISPNINNNSISTNYSSLIPEQLETTVSINNTTVEKTDAKTNVDVTKLESKTNDSPSQKKILLSQKKFFLIAGSFKKMDQAKSYLNNLSEKNINTADILPANNGRIRVSLDSFATKDDAIMAMNNYRRQNGFNSVWIHFVR